MQVKHFLVFGQAVTKGIINISCGPTLTVPVNDEDIVDNLKKRLLETAEKQICSDPGETWVIQVKGRLISMNDLVAEEALLHKQCNTNFSRGSSFNRDGAGSFFTRIV